jgi:hypothetical protein
MPCSRFVHKLVDYADACGIREEIVGDLLEEIADGRSTAWLCRQPAALYGWRLIEQLRDRISITPHAIALTLSALLLAGIAVVPAGRVLQAWFALYYVSGMLSLFAHMLSAGPAADRQAGADPTVAR